jgi:hypothetical protein
LILASRQRLHESVQIKARQRARRYASEPTGSMAGGSIRPHHRIDQQSRKQQQARIAVGFE